MDFAFSISITPEQMIYAMAAVTAILGGKFVLPSIRGNSTKKAK